MSENIKIKGHEITLLAREVKGHSANTDRVKSFMGEEYECRLKDGAACHNSCGVCDHAFSREEERALRRLELRRRALAVFAMKVGVLPLGGDGPKEAA